MNPDPASLDRLHDLVAPPPVPWWPPAPGWYYVVVLVFLIVLVLLVRGFIHWQRNRYRREALAEFAGQEKRLSDPTQRVAALAALSVLLKRTALTAYSRGEVAALTGPAWFAFLDRTGRTTAFVRGEGAKLEGAAYDPAGATKLNEAEARVLTQRVKHWLKHHRIDRPRSRPSSSGLEIGGGRGRERRTRTTGNGS